MVPSALRTLSVVTLLSAVSGSVFLLNDHGPGSTAAAESAKSADSGPKSRGGSVASAAFAIDRIPAPRIETAAHRGQLQTEAAALRERADKAADKAAAEAAAKARAKAKAAAKAKAEAAAERRREAARERASRSARRDPQALARMMAADRGWGAGQFSCLKALWTRESGWNYRATNPSSGAYGIPQSLPASKMASAGADWRTNPATQIRWGLNYIDERYGTPCAAWGHSEASGWY